MNSSFLEFFYIQRKEYVGDGKLKPNIHRVRGIYKVGPKRVANTGRSGAIYLPKELSFLKGKLVQVTIEVIDVGDGSE